MQLFTEDATVNTYFGDTLFASMRGREEIGKVFSGSGKALVLTALREHVSDAERVEIEKILRGDRDGGQP